MRTYRSITSQTCTDFEWIVVDGESKDGTVAFLRSQGSPYIHWKSEPDVGLYDAMNKGIEMAGGEYLLFLNAGDELAGPDVLEKTTATIKAEDRPDLLYGNSYERTIDGQLHKKISGPYRRIWYGMFTHHQSIFYKRSTVGSLRYRLEYPICSDYAFTGEVLARSTDIVQLPFEVSIFAQGGLSFQEEEQGERDHWKIKKEIFHMSLISRLCIRWVHSITRRIRQHMPRVYRWLRFSK